MSKAAASHSVEISRLPFVHDAAPHDEHNVQRSFWHVSETGDWAKDCELGSALALRAIDHMRKTGFTPLLGRIVEGMIQRGRFSGVECGFMSTITDIAV